jgi:hypothetical protein
MQDIYYAAAPSDNGKIGVQPTVLANQQLLKDTDWAELRATRNTRAESFVRSHSSTGRLNCSLPLMSSETGRVIRVGWHGSGSLLDAGRFAGGGV